MFVRNMLTNYIIKAHIESQGEISFDFVILNIHIKLSVENEKTAMKFTTASLNV